MSFHFHPDAEAELFEAIRYYENVEPGLGKEFAVEAYSAVQRAIAYPSAWAIIDGQIRRSLMWRFPYGVLYTEESNGILIVAIMPLHRDPDYWKGRI